MLNETPISITASVFSNRANATLYVPAGCKATYEAADYWKDFAAIQELKTDVTITIGQLEMGTYCSKYYLGFSKVSGIKAYIASGFKPSTGTAFIMNVEEVPANTGIMVKGAPGTYTIPVKKTDMYYVNMFKGTLVSMTVPVIEDGCQNYVLRKGDDDVVRFYKSYGGSTLGANKAYLQIPTSVITSAMNSREYINFEEDDVTGIVGPEYSTQEDNGEYYNLNGQRETSPKSGIYIKNGKKIIIR